MRQCMPPVLLQFNPPRLLTHPIVAPTAIIQMIQPRTDDFPGLEACGLHGRAEQMTT
jgi:hypothetical protein